MVDNGSVDGSGEALERRREITLLRTPATSDSPPLSIRHIDEIDRRIRAAPQLRRRAHVRHSEPLMQSSSRSPDAAAVAPLYISPDGSPQPFHFRFPTFTMTLANGSAVVRRLAPGSTRLLREYHMLDDDFSQPRPVPQPSASCLLFDGHSCPTDHIFDERLSDLLQRRPACALFRRSRTDPLGHARSTVVHEGHASTRMLGPTGKRQYLGSVIRMLGETEPAGQGVALPRCRLPPAHSNLAARPRPGARFQELWKALSGDVGPLPSRSS